MNDDSVVEEKDTEQESKEENIDITGEVPEDGHQEAKEEVEEVQGANNTETVTEGQSARCKGKKRPRVKAEADQGLVSGVMYVPSEEVDATSEDWTVVRNKRNRPKKAEALPAVIEAAVSTQQQEAAPQKATQPPAMKNVRRAKKRGEESVRDSWKVEVDVAAAPHMRRCIVGPGGATLKKVQQEFPGVQVKVPPPRDAVTATVTVRGPPRQVTAAVERLKALLHEAEVVEAQVAVAPHQWRHTSGAT
ncbi:hypothetical protein GWK47_009985 [Chionoecetes opilio]|uniref:K Homology domain-containing protein n=1 Tax=Chionoecetes opilio TaxID=41210 RepID=A0A8J4XY58_CHIOP|nr:hypothetical protein GWK47_009985 [Chionoecetes opilio]